MKKLIVLFLFTYQLFSCALCSVYAPNVHITTIITSGEKETSFDIEWKFDKSFVKTLKIYDTNNNGIYEKSEQVAIEKALVDYLNTTNYLTYIAYQSKDQLAIKPSIYPLKDIFYTTEVTKESMIFQYKFSLPFTLENNKRLAVAYYDEGNNFNFIPVKTLVKNYDETKIIEQDANQLFIYLYNPSKKKLETKENNTSQKLEKLDEKELEENSFINFLSKRLEEYKDEIESLLKDIKENQTPSAYLWLLVFSFIYGVVHAIGPGHGKSLVSAYFLSENKSISKALSISALIGLVHTFSAFVMTLAVYYIFSVMFSNFFLDVEKMATKVSAIIIIAIALYMIYKKYSFVKMQKSQVKWSTTKNLHASSCGCGSCNTKTTDLGVIVSSGIVPCPGTVTIFLFTFGLGIVFVGFLSAIFMSLGMSVVIFITAYLSSRMRKQASTNTLFVKLFEYGSLVFILGLGIVLFLV